MSTYTTAKAAELAQRLADQQAENDRLLATIQAEQQAHDKRLADALEHAGPARVALVEDLLEKLEIEAEPLVPQLHKRTGEVVTDKKTGKAKMVSPDPTETMRMARLAKAIDELIEAATGGSAPADDSVLAAVQGTVGDDDDGPTSALIGDAFDRSQAS